VPGNLRRAVRGQELLRAGWGLALLADPARVVAGIGVAEPDARARIVARVLGARHLAQAVVTVTRPTLRGLRWGGVVDLTHAGTGLALALADGRYRRAALTDAAIATGFGVKGLQTGDWHRRPAAP
jgi:hypothetical protein